MSEEIQPLPIPEATVAILWPPENWPKRFDNLYDAFRAQSSEMKQEIIREGVMNGTVHYITYRDGWETGVNFYLHYHDHGQFFSEWPLHKNGTTNANHWLYFQGKSCINKYGVKVYPEGVPKELRKTQG